MDSTPPVIFKRKSTAGKPTPRARDRERSPDNAVSSKEGNASETAEDSPSTLATKLKKKIQKSRTKSRLSFGADEEAEGDGEVFKVKKSSLSRKVALGTHPGLMPPTLEQATISNETPKYDAAYLKELKANTPTARPPILSNVDPYDADMSMDIGDISIQSVDMDIDELTAIPSESSIKVAKEKRDRLRKLQKTGEEDFISLAVTRRDEAPQGPHPESRLMREEDEIGEGEDEFAEFTSAQERIALGKKSRKVEAKKRRDEMKELIADAEDEDEEMAEWEQEQLRRGGHRTPEPSKAKVKEIYKAAPLPPTTPVPTLTPAISRLADQLAQLTTSHARDSASLDSLTQERLEVDNREKEMRQMVEKAEEKRAWFESFKEWLEGVAGFLDEKYPLLEQLEDDHISLLTERAKLIAKRRRDDDEDDLTLFLGSLPVVASTEPEEIDELGRTIPTADPIQQRQGRRTARTARRQLRASRRSKLAVEEEEGYSTDSSLAPVDSNAYTSALHKLHSQRKEVLADVRAEEFRDPGKGRWSSWRDKYADSYVGAWGGLGVVSVWEFWVRLESVEWDCIQDDRSLHTFKWYKGLYEFCRPGDAGTVVEERELGPDGDLVSSMISTTVIPMVCKILDGGALDVHSLRHIHRVINLSEEIEASVEADSVKFQLLLKTVTNAFQSAISDVEGLLAKFRVTQQSVPGFNPESIPARRRFLSRRVKLLKNLLRWRKYTGEKFGLGVLVGRLVEVCILDVAQGGWDVGGEHIARQVAKLLPDELVPFSMKRLR